jgi:hypothetical protein
MIGVNGWLGRQTHSDGEPGLLRGVSVRGRQRRCDRVARSHAASEASSEVRVERRVNEANEL